MPEMIVPQETLDSLQQLSAGGQEGQAFLSQMPAYVPTFNQTLHGKVDSVLFGISHVHRETVTTPLVGVSPSHDPMESHLRDVQPVSVFILPFLCYLMLLAFVRLHSYLFQSAGKLEKNWSAVLMNKNEVSGKGNFTWFVFLTMLVGFICSLWVELSSYGYVGRNWFSWVTVGAISLLYVVAKAFLFYLSSILMDIRPLVGRYLREKIFAYYNMLLLFLPFVLLDYFYAFIPQWLTLAVIGIGFVYTVVRDRKSVV